MKIYPSASFLFLLLTLISGAAIGQQTETQLWSKWRGPQGDGTAADQKPVTTWSASSNVIWKTKVPGKGHSSPIVTADKIFLTTSDLDQATQSVLCFDRESGELIWSKAVNQGGFPAKIHQKNTHASSSVAIHGDLVFALFNHHALQKVTALDFDGNVVWEKPIGAYKGLYPFGVGASPIVFEDVLIVPHENEIDGKILGLDPATGQQKWSAPRKHTNYSTPVVANVGGRDQLLISGQKAVASFDPRNGKKIWSLPAKWDVTCGTMVWDQERVYASGGYPAQQTLAVAQDGSRQLWDAPIKTYEQSMIVVGDHLYSLSDRGVVYCFAAATGKVAWKTRFKSPVSASPIYADGNLFFTAEGGQTLVVKADPTKFQPVAENQLGTSAFASFALVDDKIITRVGDDSTGKYQEWLYCLGK
jgi:outer membrane protein assembly factor BamB